MKKGAGSIATFKPELKDDKVYYIFMGTAVAEGNYRSAHKKKMKGKGRGEEERKFIVFCYFSPTTNKHQQCPKECVDHLGGN